MSRGESERDEIGASRYRMVLGALVIVGFTLRLITLDRSLYYDELWGTDLFIGRASVLLRTIYRDTQPPFPNILSFLWNSVFGDSVISIRMPSVLCGVGTIVATAKLAERFRGRRAGILAGAITALSPNAIFWSQIARHYSLGILLGVLSAVTFHRACERRDRTSLVVFAATTLAFVSSHYYAVAILGPIALGTMLMPMPKRRRTAMMAATFLSALVPVGVYVVRSAFGTMTMGKDYLRDFGLTEMRELFCWWLPVGSAAPTGEWFGANDGPRLAMEAVIGIALITGAVLAIRKKPNGAPSGWWLTAWTLSIPALLTAISLTGNEHFYIERSALFAMPFAFATLGCAASPKGRLASPILIVTVLALGFLTCVQLTRPPTGPDGRPLPDVFALASFLESEAVGDFEQRTVLSTVPMAIAHATPLAEETRMMGADDIELSRVQATVERILGDGFLGRSLSDYATRSLADFNEWKSNRMARVRFPVEYGLKDGRLGRQLAHLVRREGVSYFVARKIPPGYVREAMAEETVRFEEIEGIQNLRVWRIHPLR